VSFFNAFKDAKGDWNMAECAGVPTAVLACCTWLWKAWQAPGVPDLMAFGLGLGAVITALGAAQRLRGDADIDRDRIRRDAGLTT
jgi:hypothetical protein